MASPESTPRRGRRARRGDAQDRPAPDAADAGRSGSGRSGSGRSGRSGRGLFGRGGSDDSGTGEFGADGFGPDSSGAGGFGADNSGAGNFGADASGAGSFGADASGAGNFGADASGAGSFGADASGAGGFGAGGSRSGRSRSGASGVGASGVGNFGPDTTVTGSFGPDATGAGGFGADAGVPSSDSGSGSGSGSGESGRGSGRRGFGRAASRRAARGEDAPAQDSTPTQERSPAPRGDTWSPYAEGKRSRGPLWFAITGVAVLALLGGGLVFMWNLDSPTPASSQANRTSAPLPTGPQGKFGYAGSRETDSEALTLKEIFPSKKFAVSGRSYVMTITAKDKKCGDAVLGDKLQKALKAGKCTQLLRASFRDKDSKVIGTVGVANLSSGKDSTKVAAAGSKSNYVKPLPGKDTITKFLGAGSGGAKVRTHGHYAVMYWFQNKDGSKPDKKGFKALYQAVDDITQSTVYKALDARTRTGQPPG